MQNTTFPIAEYDSDGSKGKLNVQDTTFTTAEYDSDGSRESYTGRFVSFWTIETVLSSRGWLRVRNLTLRLSD